MDHLEKAVLDALVDLRVAQREIDGIVVQSKDPRVARFRSKYKAFDDAADAYVKAATIATVPAPRCEPPTHLYNHQHHWLDSERASSPCMSEWLRGQWHSAGEADPISPEEMARRGWRHFAAAYPPTAAGPSNEDIREIGQRLASSTFEPVVDGPATIFTFNGEDLVEFAHALIARSQGDEA